MQLNLSSDEATLVRNLLERQLGMLKEEIGKTENYEMRQDLKVDEAMLKSIINRLEETLASA